jgi:hypothetical protein
LTAAAYLATDRFREARLIIDDSASPQEAAGALDVGGHLMRILAYYYTGDLESASEAANAAWQAHGDRKPEAFPGVMALLGKRDHARRLLQDTEERFQDGKLAVASESFWGELHLGDHDKAFVWLNRAIANREHWLFPMLHHSAILNSVRDHSRFQEAMRFRQEIESLGTPTVSVAYA